jgi:mono/diheme cytochrome c family protein
VRIALAFAALFATSEARAYAPLPPHDYEPGFELTGHMPVAGATGPLAQTGSRIAAAGDGALVIDADSGDLVLADALGGRVASLAIGAGAGLLVVDAAANRAFIADRKRDRIAVVAVHERSLERVGELATPPEPYGLALSPDARTLLVTAIADHVVIALDPATGAERWRESVGEEPRAVAMSPDGKHAIVSHLTTGQIETIDLDKHRVTMRVLRHDLGPRCTDRRDEKSSASCPDPEATAYPRSAFAALFLANDVAAVAFERESPVPRPGFAAAHTYGGSAVPITHHVAFVGIGGAQAVAQLSLPAPRALAYDEQRDTLYIAGMADDHLLLVEHARRQPAWGDRVRLAPDDNTTPDADRLAGIDTACGLDGLAIATNGDVLAWCAFTRSIRRVQVAESPKSIPKYLITVASGPAIAGSHMTAMQHAGFVRFHHATRAIAHLGRAACASCHVDGRSDGLAWQIEGHTLRTPVLAGRVAGTAPYKWLGGDADLQASIGSTIQRLGGYQSGKYHEPNDPLVAYLESLPAPRVPTRPADAVARGKHLFETEGCAGCHAGRELTDHQRHSFGGSDLELDTPSLHGVAAAPRLLHDGSAATLDDVLRERGSIRGMIPRPLAADERADLAAFLETL